MTDPLHTVCLVFAIAIAGAAICIGIPFLIAHAITYCVPLRNARRELVQGCGVASFVYQRLKSHPDEWSVVTDGVYGDLVMHNVEDVGVELHPSYRQCAVIVGYRKNRVGRFLNHGFFIGVLLSGRVSGWNRRKK